MEVFNFARNFKISRFTIDVLVQRLSHVTPRRLGASDECARVVGQTHASVTACDQLLNDLCAQFYRAQSIDGGTMAALNAGFDELRGKIGEIVARLNSFEYAGAREI